MKIYNYQQFTFQKDNDPKHMSKSVIAWFQKNKITVLPWPSMNPDETPSENLQQEMKVAINHQSPKNLKDLECVTTEEWKEFPDKICSNFIKTFKKQFQKVIKMRSHSIDKKYGEDC